MANTVYDNFYLSNEVEDQYNSHLNLQQFCTIDNSLTGTAGMTRKINVYKATDGTEKLQMGKGNTKSIEVTFTAEEYKIALAQNRFDYFDEQVKTDPMLVPVGVRHMGTDMFNTINKDVYTEFEKATMVVPVTTFDFDSFVDAQSMLNVENLEDINIFAFVSPANVADLRKALKDSLQYVSEFAKNGYIGTVGGVNVFTKKDCPKGQIITATKQAVTLFNKTGVEVEQATRSADEANIRKNSIFSRKYYIAALTNETQAVKIVKGSAKVTTDESKQEKTYYLPFNNGYIVGTPKTNPKTEGFYEITISK